MSYGFDQTSHRKQALDIEKMWTFKKSVPQIANIKCSACP